MCTGRCGFKLDELLFRKKMAITTHMARHYQGLFVPEKGGNVLTVPVSGRLDVSGP
jgi:hypothetical protein